jgi:hypothetical protein
MTIKSLEKINLRKKTEGILLFDLTNWYWVQKKLFGYLFWSLYVDTKCHIFTVGSQNIAHVSKLRKMSKEYLSPQKTQKAAVFFIQKNLDLKMLKILTNLKILIMFVHIVKLHGIPPPKMQFLKFFFCSVYFQVIYQRRHLKLLPWMGASETFQISYSKSA